MKIITIIPVNKLRPFDGHPYKIKDDDEMNALIESIQENGILSPLIVRPIENTNEYEVISGHRRLHAAEKAGITEVPALIYALDRDSAAALPWWTAICTVSIFFPVRKPLRIK
ncbi:MAG: ParB N-terminal domain-containing protein [Eubacteriales bacterium]|nr:ParB N-terminal domain-containing protein [Eubacteriales bacterium]